MAIALQVETASPVHYEVYKSHGLIRVKLKFPNDRVVTVSMELPYDQADELIGSERIVGVLDDD